MKSRNRLKGFTLIELMIAVMIIAILASIAYPLYTSQVRKTARKEAAGIVLEVAGRLERIRTQLLSYPTVEADINALEQSTRRYTIAVTATTATTFTISATPLNDQLDDICGTFTYNSGGIWAFGNSQTQENCL